MAPYPLSMSVSHCYLWQYFYHPVTTRAATIRHADAAISGFSGVSRLVHGSRHYPIFEIIHTVLPECESDHLSLCRLDYGCAGDKTTF